MEQKENKILKAVRSKEVNQLRELLRAPSLDAWELNEAASAAAAATEPLYVTLLFKAGAAGAGSFEVLRDLLAVGAEPNIQNQESVTPLCASAAQGHTACVDLLLRAGADPNGRGAASQSRRFSLRQLMVMRPWWGFSSRPVRTFP
jgi:ankyrin repeat protein